MYDPAMVQNQIRMRSLDDRLRECPSRQRNEVRRKSWRQVAFKSQEAGGVGGRKIERADNLFVSAVPGPIGNKPASLQHACISEGRPRIPDIVGAGHDPHAGFAQ